MSYPPRPIQGGLHPAAMRKSVSNPTSGGASVNAMRDVVQRAAQARESGRGGRLMGGIGVGPTGQPQLPFASAQHSVSGQKGRQGAVMNAMFQQTTPGGQHEPSNLSPPRNQNQHYGQSPYQAHPPPPQPQRHSGARTNDDALQGDSAPALVLVYDGRSPDSMYFMQKFIEQHRKPHLAVFRTTVTVVDARRPSRPHLALVEKLESSAQFCEALNNGCVLFNRNSQRAYTAVNTMNDIINAQKDVVVGRMIEDYLAGGAASGALGHDASSTRGRRVDLSDEQQRNQPTALPARRSVTDMINEGGGSTGGGAALQRRSVLGGMSNDALERLAEETNRRIERRPTSAGHSQRQMGGGGGFNQHQMDEGGGDSFFSSYGNQQGNAAGGAEGAIVQIQASKLRK